MNDIALTTFSSFDIAGSAARNDAPERFYHGFVLGLMVELKGSYEVTSNRESGFGRYDIMLIPRKMGRLDPMVIEFKVRKPRKEASLEETVAAALQQIEDKEYDCKVKEKARDYHMNLNQTSKFLSLILRHKPEAIGITLDEHGWADVAELIEGIRRTKPFTMEMLEEIVRTDSKQRYSFNQDKTLIRANQGHSIPVDVELQVVKPPEYLYHGTGQKYVESIDRTGLLPKSRLYVHLSSERETAVKVGSRHGKPVVYRVKSGQMQADGRVFYRSVNGVWLTKQVPAEYLEKI